MGLDMYAYRIKKASSRDIKDLITNGIRRDGILFIENDKLDSNKYADLKPFVTEVSYISREHIDLEKIKKAFNIPEDAHNFYTIKSREFTQYKFSWTDQNGKKCTKSVDIPQEESEKYLYDNPFVGYVVKYEEVGYWRKEYDLQDQLYSLYEGSIENCGFHKCNPEMIQAMHLRCRDDNNIFYCEWY